MRYRFLVLLLFASCGYHFEGSEKNAQTTLSIPYIKGDGQGILNTELVKVLSSAHLFDYVQNGGALTLEASLIADGDDRIGFRFDRDPATGKRRDNIVGTENRRSMSVQIQLIDTYTQKVVFGPQVISATADYDYVDENSIRDLAFITPPGTPVTVLNFSLGQLDSVDGAHDDSDRVVYRQLAQKIADILVQYR